MKKFANTKKRNEMLEKGNAATNGFIIFMIETLSFIPAANRLSQCDRFLDMLRDDLIRELEKFERIEKELAK